MWLYLDPENAEDSLPNLDVIGGEGNFAMDGLREGKQVRYLNPEGGSEIVAIWTSDQGCELEAKYICRDLSTVLGCARYLFDNGAFDPRLNWVIA